jgi:hypothetical protein
MSVIVALSQSGEQVDFRVQEIISIDGVPFARLPQAAELQEQIQNLEGRLSALEHVLGVAISPQVEPETAQEE